jgi:hypothetical protein
MRSASRKLDGLPKCQVAQRRGSSILVDKEGGANFGQRLCRPSALTRTSNTRLCRRMDSSERRHALTPSRLKPLTRKCPAETPLGGADAALRAASRVDYSSSGERAQTPFWEFFVPNIRNPHTRRAYLDICSVTDHSIGNLVSLERIARAD